MKTEEQVDKDNLCKDEQTQESMQADTVAGDGILEEKAKPKAAKKKTKVQLELEVLQSEYEKMQNYAVRTKADLENIKKRNENISRERYQDGRFEVVIEMLPVVDTIARALALDMDEKMKEGLSMIKKQFDVIFTKMGITEILAEGQPFDPNLHNALMQIDNPAVSGQCVQVYEKGYKYHERVIRHASVVVAK